jgi:hypothetical protein
VNALGGGCRWLDSSTGFLCSLIPGTRGPEPKEPAVPTGPAIQENTGTAAPSPTFEDLLKNPHDEKLYEHFYTSQLAWVDLAGVKTPFGTPGIYQGANISPDSRLRHRHAHQEAVLVRRAGVLLPARHRALEQGRRPREETGGRADGRHVPAQRRVSRCAGVSSGTCLSLPHFYISRRSMAATRRRRSSTAIA